MSTVTRFGPRAAAVTALYPSEIERLESRPVLGCPGVSAKILCHDSGMVSSLITYLRSATTPGSPHTADQYIWVLSGEVSLGGKALGAGCFVHVPAGVAHPITGIGPNGCVILQIHVPPTAAVGRMSTEPIVAPI